MTHKKKIPAKLRKRRAWSEMLPITQQVAQALEDSLCSLNQGKVLSQYDMGMKVNAVLSDTESNGPDAVA
jgi:hypothetical protein